MTFLESVDGKSITIRTIDYMIKVLTPNEIDAIEDCEVFGIASHKDSNIYLREGMSDDRAKQTLAHEILHAMIYESGYDFEDADQEESIVEALSLVMNDMVRDGTMSLQYAQTSQTEEATDQVQPWMSEHFGEPIKMYLLRHEDDFSYVVDSDGFDKWLTAVANHEGSVYIYDHSCKQTFDVVVKHITSVRPLHKSHRGEN